MPFIEKNKIPQVIKLFKLYFMEKMDENFFIKIKD